MPAAKKDLGLWSRNGLRKVQRVGCQYNVEGIFPAFCSCCIALHGSAEWSLYDSTSRIASGFTRAIRARLAGYALRNMFLLLAGSFGQASLKSVLRQKPTKFCGP